MKYGDDILAAEIRVDGAKVGPRRKALNFIGGEATDNPETEATDIEFGEGGGSHIGRLTVAADTVGLFPFDRALNDISANAFELQLLAGVVRYAPLFPGYWGAFLPAGSRLQQTVANTALRLLGDMTLEFVACPMGLALSTTNRVVYHGTDSTGSSAVNNVWAFQWYQTGGGDLAWSQHFGASSVSAAAWEGRLPAPFRPAHVVATRESNVARVYIDGALVGTSAALTAPTDGTSGRLIIGSATHTGFMISDLRVSNTAHSEAQIIADYNATLGGHYGEIEAA